MLSHEPKTDATQAGTVGSTCWRPALL